MLPKPYYDQDGITIYHADCREILPYLPKVDLVLTDPPYGIASIWKGGFNPKHGWGKAHTESELRNQWDKPLDQSFARSLCFVAPKAIIWGGNYYEFPASRGWLVWNKPERNFSLSEAELAWSNLDTVIRVFDCPRSDTGREHPTQKPLRLMKWSINRAGDVQSILDPFMGSGTTLVAAKQLHRRAIGIEIEERYCAIAVRRLGQGVLPL